MNITAMRCFLSEENILRHMDYLNTLKLKLSVIEKSFPEMQGLDISQISRTNLPADAKSDAAELMWRIKSHTCFFDSFVEENSINKNKKKLGISVEKIIYDVYSLAMEKEYGFIYMFVDKKSRPRLRFTHENDGAFVKYMPLISIDLYEHTYFSDYGFKKDKFLRNALIHLDLNKLS